jgi:hypothetical protein
MARSLEIVRKTIVAQMWRVYAHKVAGKRASLRARVSSPGWRRIMDDTFSATLKSIGAIVLTFALFLGVGYYVYSALFVAPATERAQMMASHASPPAPVNEKTTTQHPG